ncbi:MAG: hypothetical protein IJJ86_06205 [Clostridia bacterium]|nr:hypothetical protein [Clostridia bacterium]
MKEKDYFCSMIQEYAVDDAKVAAIACVPVRKRAAAWKRAAAAAAIGAAALIATVFAIPSARAEVLSWFRVSSADQYLAVDPAERTAIPGLDALITTPAPDHGNRIKVDYVCSEPLYREIAEDFSAVMRETFFDGNKIYVSIDFDGLSGYPVYEDNCEEYLLAGTPHRRLLAEPGSMEELRKELSDDPQQLAAFESGAAEYWYGPSCELVLSLPDAPYGELHSWIYYLGSEDELAFERALRETYGSFHSIDEEAASAYRRQIWEYVRENGTHAVAVFDPDPEDGLSGRSVEDLYAKYADENGVVRFTAKFVVDTRGCERPETKLVVDLGTVEVDLNAYKTLPKYRLTPADAEPVGLSGSAVQTTGLRYERGIVTNREIDLNGVSVAVKNGGSLDALGLHGLELTMTFPEDWSDEMRLAFVSALHVTAVIDGETELMLAGNAESIESGSCTLRLSCENTLLFRQFDRITSVRLTPKLWRVSSILIQKKNPLWVDPVLETVEEIPLGPNDSFDTRSVDPDRNLFFRTEEISDPAWTITLNAE